jgi:hypothetical protein
MAGSVRNLDSGGGKLESGQFDGITECWTGLVVVAACR